MIGAWSKRFPLFFPYCTAAWSWATLTPMNQLAFVITHNGATEVKVEMDAPAEYEEFMNEAWPKALARLKEICEV